MPSRASAFSSTQRIERSSSTIQTAFHRASPAARCRSRRHCIVTSDLPHQPRLAEFQRQQNREHRAAGNALAFDRAAVLRDERLRERQPEAAAAFAPRHQRDRRSGRGSLRECRARCPRSTSDERQAMAALGQRHAARNARRHADLADRRVAAGERLRGVAHDVEHRLHQLLRVGLELRQAGVEIADDRQSPETRPARRP